MSQFAKRSLSNNKVIQLDTEQLQNELLKKEEELKLAKQELKLEEKQVDATLERLKQEHQELKEARTELESEEKMVDQTLERLKKEHSELKVIKKESIEDKVLIENLNTELEKATHILHDIVKSTRKKQFFIMSAMLLVVPLGFFGMLFLDANKTEDRLVTIEIHELESGNYKFTKKEEVSIKCKQLLRLQNDTNPYTLKYFEIGDRIIKSLHNSHCPLSYEEWRYSLLKK
ncbi:MAG: hypothetical protein HN826_08020 [Methylococcales bacterium]|nr:hypothetical protein [Methylococcales bacterium]